METIYIADKRLEKYKRLLNSTAKIIGRMQNKIDDRSLGANLSIFCREFEYLNRPTDNGNPIVSAITKDFRKFFFDVVFEIAVIEKVKIKYHYVPNENALLGTNIREPFSFTEASYIDFLKDKGVDINNVEAYVADGINGYDYGEQLYKKNQSERV